MSGRPLAFAFSLAFAGTAAAADFSAPAVHKGLIDSFNGRNWEALQGMLAEDIVFHRANAKEVFSGPGAVTSALRDPIAEKWNVKFARLQSTSQFVGKDSRVVERGDFIITAGPQSETCYRGSYLMTWAPQADRVWKLQMLAWQDVETEKANCGI
jgi:hypothetical protein